METQKETGDRRVTTWEQNCCKFVAVDAMYPRKKSRWDMTRSGGVWRVDDWQGQTPWNLKESLRGRIRNAGIRNKAGKIREATK